MRWWTCLNGLNLNLKLEQDDPPRLSRRTRVLGPFSSVVERATRNGEVGCSIQPMGSDGVRHHFAFDF